MANQNIVGPVVRRLRMAKGLSQEAFVAKCQVAGWDVSRGTLSKIEARLRRVNDAEVMMLAQVLKCPSVKLLQCSKAKLTSVLRHGMAE